MTNEEKAKELAFESPQCQMYIDNKCNQNFPCDRFKVALEMAKWKDEEQSKEKQQWIEKATKFFEEADFGGWIEEPTDELIEEFVKVMKGE